MRSKPALLVAGLACGTLALPAHAIELVKDAKPSATIVVRDTALKAKPYVPAAGVAATPDAKVHLAALDLQKYVQKMTGALLPIVAASEETKGAVVLVGSSDRTAKLELKIPAGITRERAEEGYLLLARGDVLVLAGNDEGPYNGSYFAVAEFLHRQGIRWYVPSDFGEIVPMQKSPLLGHEDRILPCVYTPELIAALEKHVAEAERLADTERTTVHFKVDRLILEHLKAYQAMHAAEFDGNFAAVVVIAEGWVWMNGKYVGRRNYVEAYVRPAPVEFDVTDAVLPGKKNVIAVRVSTGMNLTQAPDGFQGRLFLYTPKPGVKE